MSAFSVNPYYSPEDCGLKIIEVHERPNLSYEFDMVVLWEDVATGERYWDFDSGCSCPAPFENVRSLSDLQNLRFTEAEYDRAVREVSKPRWCFSCDEEPAPPVQSDLGITVLHDFVLCEEVPVEEKRASGLYVPQTAQSERNIKVKVLAVGPGAYNNSGTFIPTSVQPGDVVLVPAQHGMRYPGRPGWRIVEEPFVHGVLV